jgi:hypothetical protein
MKTAGSMPDEIYQFDANQIFAKGDVVIQQGEIW